MEAYKSVLQNKDSFFSTEGNKNIYLNEFLKEISAEYSFQVLHFTVLDMDGDKIPEVVLDISLDGKNYSYFYEILHYMNGRVYGYNRPYRGLGNLKIDGTYLSSGGGGNNSYNKIIFLSNGYEYDVLGCSKFSTDHTILYFVNQELVTVEAFESFRKEQTEKKDAPWYEFSQKNIEMELTNK
jgi:hypothetical protein